MCVILQDGSWGCLCDAHLIQREGLSLLSAILSTLSNTLRSRQMITTLNNSLEVKKRNTFTDFYFCILCFRPSSFFLIPSLSLILSLSPWLLRYMFNQIWLSFSLTLLTGPSQPFLLHTSVPSLYHHMTVILR